MEVIKMCLWRKTENKNMPFDEIAKMAYDAFMLFTRLPEKYRPNFLTVKRKKDAKMFDWSYENFYEYLKSGVNKSGEIVFEDLGYSISFFSSLENSETFGYSMSVGIKNPLFINTFIIKISPMLSLIDKDNANLISEIFAETVSIFKPFWGAIINKSIQQGKDNYPNTKERKISSIHWLNYFSEDYFNNIEKEKLMKIDKVFPKASFENGILKLQETAIHADSDEDIRYKKMVEDYLIGV